MIFFLFYEKSRYTKKSLKMHLERKFGFSESHLCNVLLRKQKLVVILSEGL